MWQIVVPIDGPNVKKIRPTVMEECARMDSQTARQTDGQTDWTLSYIPQF